MTEIIEDHSGVLEKAAECFTSARRNLVEGAAHLHLISSQNMWRGHTSSFGEFVEKHCHISESFAAKLCKIYDYFVVNGGVPRESLAGVDSEKLYLAMRLEGSAEEQVQKAQYLSRKDIKEQLKDEEFPDCQHETFETYQKCLSCGRFHRV